VEVTIEGHPQNVSTYSMLKAALNIPYPHLVIQAVSAAVPSPAQAHICLDTVCLPPVSDPEELARAVEEALSPQESPFQNIFGSLI